MAMCFPEDNGVQVRSTSILNKVVLRIVLSSGLCAVVWGSV